jgi:hypothetical protein
MSKNQSNLTTPGSARTTVDAFLDQTHAVAQHSGRPRLLFAVDATASREGTWDRAATLTASMFAAVTALDAQLDIQLIFYRGAGPGECKASRWISDGRELARLMSKVRCESGETQIGRVLAHAQRENAGQKVAALAFIGDMCEESRDTLCAAAGRLNLPVFVFQEGNDRHAAKVFGDIARLTRGAHCRFDRSSAKHLAQLLGAVAAYATGGQQALKDMASTNAGAVRLLQQLR